MTHQETIEALNNLIVYLNGCILQKNITLNTKRYIIDCLERIGINNTIINTINSIGIKENAFSFLAQYNPEIAEHEKQTYEKNRQAIQSILNILTLEKARFVEEEAHQRAIEEQTKNLKMQERAIAEQKKGNRIMIWTLWATAVGITISIVIAICK